MATAGSTETSESAASAAVPLHRVGSDVPFYAMLTVLGGSYVVLLAGLLVADISYIAWAKANEVQRVTLSGVPDGGSFTLTFVNPLPEKQTATELTNRVDSSEATQLTVIDSNHFPSAPFVVRIDGEDMRVTSMQADRLTVTRGLNGTAPVAHQKSARIILAETTGAIPFDATAADVQVALEGLSSIGGGTNLVGEIDELATSLVVDDASVFSAIPFTIRIHAEEMQVNSVQENTLTVRRGVNGTTAVPHIAAAKVANDLAVSGDELPLGFIDIEFMGVMEYTDVDPLTADKSNLTGNGDESVLVSTQLDAALPESLEWCRPALRPVVSMVAVLSKQEIRYSIKLTMISCLITAILSLFVAVPIGYILSRFRFFGRDFIDALLDIPIVLPPLVVGLCLLILFQFWPFSAASRWVVFQIPAVILAQFMVAAAFAVRIMRATFDQIDTRLENVALTLGCTQAQAFGRVVLPQARQGMLTAGTLAWARALGEFGPLLIFAGAVRNKTEVLSTTVYLELSTGNLKGAAAISLLMILAAVTVLVIARVWGSRSMSL